MDFAEKPAIYQFVFYACATRDLVYEDDTIKARDVHLSTLSSLKGYYGKVMRTAEYLKEIP